MGIRADVYRNLHDRIWSLRHARGKQRLVFAHAAYVDLRDVTCVVSAARRRAALVDGSRNVHAVIRGTVTWYGAAPPPKSDVDDAAIWREVHYNPFRAAWFTARCIGDDDDGGELCAVEGAARALFVPEDDRRPHGTVWMQGARLRPLPPEQELSLLMRALLRRRQKVRTVA